MQKEHNRKSPWIEKYDLGILIFIFIFGLLLRLSGLSMEQLWYDETQSLTHAILPMDDLLMSVREFDPHPPAYYIQLHFWMEFGYSDVWIKLNSVFWSALTIISVYLITKDFLNTRAALFSAVLFSLAPYSIAYAQEVRMYSLLMLLSVWIFFFLYRFLCRKTIVSAIGLFVTTLLFLYSHGAGFLIFFSIFGAGMLCLFLRNDDIKSKWLDFAHLVGLLVLLFLLYLPWLTQAVNIRVGHTSDPNLETVFNTFSILIIGFGREIPPWIFLTLLFLLLVGSAYLIFRVKDVRLVFFVFYTMPILFCFLISKVYRPIWLYRTLSFVVPFIFITLSWIISSVSSLTFLQKKRSLFFSYGMLFIVSLFLIIPLNIQSRSMVFPNDFRSVAGFLDEVVEPGSNIYVPSGREYWGLAWTYFGPGSINPLDESDYCLQNEDNIVMLTRSTINQNCSDDSCYWIVYQDYHQPDPFEISPEDIVKTMGNMVIAYTCNVPDH